MKVQFKMLIFVICLNLATGLTLALALPGTEYVGPTDPGSVQQDPSYYEEHFNATETAGRWGANTNLGIPVVGDIFSGFYFLMVNWHFLIDGFPLFLSWLSNSFITDASGRVAFTVICNALRALYAVLMSIFVFELISGRYLAE